MAFVKKSLHRESRLSFRQAAYKLSKNLLGPGRNVRVLCSPRPSMTGVCAFPRLPGRFTANSPISWSPYGLDECWLDVTGSISLFGGGRAIADELLRRIRQELDVTASMGDSCNKTCLAKSVFWGLHLKMRIFRAFPGYRFAIVLRTLKPGYNRL